MSSKLISATSSFAENVHRLLERIDCRPLTSEADLDAALRLRYASYLKEGTISPNESLKLADRYDALDNVVNIGVFYADRLVAAKRFHFLSTPQDLSPSYTSFPDILGPQLDAGKRIIDPNRFVVDYGTAREFPHLVYATLRLTVIASEYYSTHFTTAAVRVEHQAFYKRAFFAVQAAPPRSYPNLTKELCLMLIDVNQNRDRIYERGPYFMSTPAEQERLFGKIKRGASEKAAVAA